MVERMICMNVTYVCSFIQKANKNIKEKKNILCMYVCMYVCNVMYVMYVRIKIKIKIKSNKIFISPAAIILFEAYVYKKENRHHYTNISHTRGFCRSFLGGSCCWSGRPG